MSTQPRHPGPDHRPTPCPEIHHSDPTTTATNMSPSQWSEERDNLLTTLRLGLDTDDRWQAAFHRYIAHQKPPPTPDPLTNHRHVCLHVSRAMALATNRLVHLFCLSTPQNPLTRQINHTLNAIDTCMAHLTDVMATVPTRPQQHPE